MPDSKRFEDIIQRLNDAVPDALRDIDHDLKGKFRAILQGSLAQLDFVTREEFDTQTKVLARTRQKLDTLEKEISQLQQADTEHD